MPQTSDITPQTTDNTLVKLSVHPTCWSVAHSNPHPHHVTVPSPCTSPQNKREPYPHHGTTHHNSSATNHNLDITTSPSKCRYLSPPHPPPCYPLHVSKKLTLCQNFRATNRSAQSKSSPARRSRTDLSRSGFVCGRGTQSGALSSLQISRPPGEDDGGGQKRLTSITE